MIDKGVKHDQGKPDLTFLFEYFPEALIEVSKVAGFGAEKYERGNWVDVVDAHRRYEAALLRHLIARYIPQIKIGDPHPLFDSESTLLHLAHAAWNSLAILQLYIRKHAAEEAYKEGCAKREEMTSKYTSEPEREAKSNPNLYHEYLK
jgi:hypothetical protein